MTKNDFKRSNSKKCQPLYNTFLSAANSLRKRLMITKKNSKRTRTITTTIKPQQKDRTTCSIPRPEARHTNLLENLKDDGIYVHRDFIQLENKPIGEGQFGYVYRAILHLPLPTFVTVKTIREQHRMDINVYKRFIKEGLRMKDYQDNPHLMNLTAISFHENGMPMVVTPWMPRGNLLSYIRNDKNTLNIGNLLHFGIQIANGMETLASLSYVHHDLAAKNCLLDWNFDVKLADFSLSDEIFQENNYCSQNKSPTSEAELPLSIRWMAIESIENGKHTIESNIWSFGVLLWELLTRGGLPYCDINIFQIHDYLKAGFRLRKPASCPGNLYRTMMACWKENPCDRPNFTQLSQEIAQTKTTIIDSDFIQINQSLSRRKTLSDVRDFQFKVQTNV